MPSQSIIDKNSKPKSEIIDERQANLPLPDQPPVASDWNSSDASKVNVGSGGVEEDISYGGGGSSLKGPATSDSAENVGRQAHDNLDGLPKDAKKR